MRRFVEVVAEQRSAEWFAARLGRLTGSVASDAFAKLKDGKTWGAGRRNLMLRLVCERVTGRPQERNVQTQAMQDGIDREPLAFAAYEALTGEMVQRSGFLSHLDHMAGCSLDGHIGDYDVLLSIKCRQPAAHLDFLKSGAIPVDAMTQILHELWITGAREHHYFSFNPDFPAALQSKMVVVHEHGRTMTIQEYEDKALAFLAECDREYEALLTLSNPAGQLAASLEK